MITLYYTDTFKKHYQKLSDKEQLQFKEKLEFFKSNPFHPSLRVHKIQGTSNVFEFSVNMDIRVIWIYQGSDIIALIDIGHHNILRKY